MGPAFPRPYFPYLFTSETDREAVLIGKEPYRGPPPELKTSVPAPAGTIFFHRITPFMPRPPLSFEARAFLILHPLRSVLLDSDGDSSCDCARNPIRSIYRLRAIFLCCLTNRLILFRMLMSPSPQLCTSDQARSSPCLSAVYPL